MIFWQLLRTDLSLFFASMKDKFINQIVWVAAVTLVSGYIMQSFGLSNDFGAFQVGSIIIGSIGTEIYGQLFAMLADIEGPRYINYQLILPVSNFVVLLARATFFMINGLFLSITMLPLCKLILLDRLSLGMIDYPKFVLTLVVSNLFFSWFTLWMTSLVKDVLQVDNVIMRILFPIWYFGCYSFSFKVAWQISPILGSLCLLSPYTFATEALRSSMLGASAFLPFWLCIAVLLGMTLGACWLSYTRLKARLDFI